MLRRHFLKLIGLAPVAALIPETQPEVLINPKWETIAEPKQRSPRGDEDPGWTYWISGPRKFYMNGERIKGDIVLTDGCPGVSICDVYIDGQLRARFT